MKLNHHPAPGLKGRLGYYMGARFAVPENPVRRDSRMITALTMSDKIQTAVRQPRLRNALAQSMSGLQGCAIATPIPRTGTGQVQKVESSGETPLWIHIAVGGILSAIALRMLNRR